MINRDRIGDPGYFHHADLLELEIIHLASGTDARCPASNQTNPKLSIETGRYSYGTKTLHVSLHAMTATAPDFQVVKSSPKDVAEQRRKQLLGRKAARF
jgi:hypothetical protein